jgi:pimeloyl-ACP methyl ester carboxylesterase
MTILLLGQTSSSAGNVPWRARSLLRVTHGEFLVTPLASDVGARQAAFVQFRPQKERDMSELPNIVLVHGAWADGSSWSGVIPLLQRAGHDVVAPQFPLTSLDDNVARLRQVLAAQTGPTLVAGHSYGGQIMTALGNDAPNVVGLVYVSAFALDEGESIGALLGDGELPPALQHLRIDAQGFAWLPQDDFVKHFAADIDVDTANVMYAVQQPLAASALADVMGPPAWKNCPTWYAVAQNDEAIPPDAERQFAQRMGATTTELVSGHVGMVSHPDEVANLILDAAKTLSS